MALIEAYPGIHFRELLRRSGLGSGALHYQLSVLQREGLLLALKVKGLKQFYPMAAAPNPPR